MASTSEAPVNVLKDDDDEDEYVVEAIRDKRKKSGGIEYLIKWENYPESDNTWEPPEHLKCPEIVQQFEEKEKNKRRRKKAERIEALSSETPSKKARLASTSSASQATSSGAVVVDDAPIFVDDTPIFVEDDDDDLTPINGRSQNGRATVEGANDRAAASKVSQRGFERGLDIERILTASIGDDNKLYFVLKWEGRTELEMVEADELEARAPIELCRWYRQRLYWCINDPSEAAQPSEMGK